MDDCDPSGVIGAFARHRASPSLAFGVIGALHVILSHARRANDRRSRNDAHSAHDRRSRNDGIPHSTLRTPHSSPSLRYITQPSHFIKIRLKKAAGPSPWNPRLLDDRTGKQCAYRFYISIGGFSGFSEKKRIYSAVSSGFRIAGCLYSFLLISFQKIIALMRMSICACYE